MLQLIQFDQKYIKMTTTNSLSWEGLSLTHNKTNKSILCSLDGKVNCGEFLTVMGQSGAGKSSFLSILTARITHRTRGFTVEGQVLMNGQKYDSTKFARCAAYVRQDDIILGTMTVEQTFEFQARLKLHELSEVEQQYKISQIIKQLNLEQCKKTLIGGQFSKSISGGQRKRVAIGVELLADPSCLVLDEPTSGLDSSNSLKIMRIMKKLAEDGRVVIATIHQPSTLMFQEMDKLMLMGKGRTLFFGMARQIVPYMKSIGISVNPHMNPADFFMLEVSEYKNSQSYKTPMTPENYQQYRMTLADKQSVPERSPRQSIQPTFNRSQAEQASVIKQFPILFKRSFKNYFRTISNLYGKVLVLVIIPIFMAALYHNIGNEFPTDTDPNSIQDYLRNMGAFFFMFTFFNFGMNVYDTILAFPPEKQLVLKETSSRLYSMSTYYFCRCLIQMPISIMICVASTTIVYFVSGLQPQAEYYLKFILVTTLIAICGYMFGSFIGIIFSTSEHAIQILPIIIIPLVLFGGLVVNLKTIPEYSSWAQYLSPIRHTYSALILDQMSSERMHNIIQSQEIKDFMGVSGQFWPNVGYLACIAGGCGVASLVTLYLKKKPI